mgnify:CR=1 FL=1
MKNNKAFTLIELVLAITILLGIIGAVVINYDSMVGNSRYFEARENLKTYLINLKHQSAFQQKQFELTFDPDYNMYSSFEDFYLLEAVTNDLKILQEIISRLNDDSIQVRGEAFNALLLNKNEIHHPLRPHRLCFRRRKREHPKDGS